MINILYAAVRLSEQVNDVATKLNFDYKMELSVPILGNWLARLCCAIQKFVTFLSLLSTGFLGSEIVQEVKVYSKFGPRRVRVIKIEP